MIQALHYWMKGRRELWRENEALRKRISHLEATLSHARDAFKQLRVTNQEAEKFIDSFRNDSRKMTHDCTDWIIYIHRTLNTATVTSDNHPENKQDASPQSTA